MLFDLFKAFDQIESKLFSLKRPICISYMRNIIIYYKSNVLDFYILSGKVSLVSRVYVERFIVVTTLSRCCHRIADPDRILIRILFSNLVGSGSRFFSKVGSGSVKRLPDLQPWNHNSISTEVRILYQGKMRGLNVNGVTGPGGAVIHGYVGTPRRLRAENLQGPPRAQNTQNPPWTPKNRFGNTSGKWYIHPSMYV